MLQNALYGGLWLLQPLTVVALLLLASADRGPGLPKAKVRLEPPWVNVLTEDTVTLSCHGAHSPGDPSTRWFRDGVAILTQAEPSFSFKAGSNDTGDYRCQTSQTNLSDPVRLVVTSDWLLVQTQSFVLQEGERMELRCHSWRNKPLYKISFFQDGKAKSFSHMNSSFSIPQVNVNHSGSYHCAGLIGNTPHASPPTSITVQGPAVPSISPLLFPWPQIMFCLMMVLLFAVDTGLYFFVWKELQSTVGKWRNEEVLWSKNLEDK